MILWSFFWKNGYNVTSQILELCIVNWSMKKNVRHKPNENLRNGFDNEETQKTKWALFTIWLQIKLFKNENLPQSVQNSKNRKESQKMCKIQKFKWKWHGNKMPYLQQNIHTKNGKEQNLNTLKSCISNKITKKSLRIWNDDCENFSNMRHKPFYKSKTFLCYT